MNNPDKKSYNNQAKQSDNHEQASTVKEMIIDSMKNVYVDMGQLPPADFKKAAGTIADRIIEKTQQSLIVNTVYEKAVKESKPLKKKAKK